MNNSPVRPQLKFFASLWTLRQYPVDDCEWSLAQKFAEVKRQGFDAIAGGLIPEAPTLCRQHELDYILFIDIDGKNAADRLPQALEYRPQRINVQLCDHDTTPEDAARAWIKVVKLAQELRLSVDLELHRDTATETPEKAYAIAEIVKRETGRPVRFSLDFSHFAVVKHLMPPYAPRLLDHPEILAPVRQMHLRPFGGHHAQIPASDGRGGLSPEFLHYRDFLESLLTTWIQQAPTDAVLYVCPENGPRIPGSYGLSCFPDVWQDALLIRDQVQGIWRRREYSA